MVRKAWGLLVFVFLSASAINAIAAEVGLVTVAHGQIKLQEEKSAAADLKPFVKLRSGDRISSRSAASRIAWCRSCLSSAWMARWRMAIGGVRPLGAATRHDQGPTPDSRAVAR